MNCRKISSWLRLGAFFVHFILLFCILFVYLQKIDIMADTFTGTDKFKHFAACFVGAVLHPLFAIVLALGKEYGDKNTVGNHWCWKDIVADTCGVILGSIIWFNIWY